MPAPMGRIASILFAASAAVLFAACGNSIGDSCSTSTDCAQDGTRSCDTSSPDGYCTIEGCDYNTCPDEAVCVRFYPGLMTDATCDVAASDGCDLGEVCTVQGLCAPRSIERRFCMLECSGDGDCRDGYECRTRDVMVLHGGEPVPHPTDESMSRLDQGFCAARARCSDIIACADPGYTCDGRYCVR